MGTDSKLKKSNRRIRKFFSRLFRKKKKHQNYEEIKDAGSTNHINDTGVRLSHEDGQQCTVIKTSQSVSLVQGNTDPGDKTTWQERDVDIDVQNSKNNHKLETQQPESRRAPLSGTIHYRHTVSDHPGEKAPGHCVQAVSGQQSVVDSPDQEVSCHPDQQAVSGFSYQTVSELAEQDTQGHSEQAPGDRHAHDPAGHLEQAAQGHPGQAVPKYSEIELRRLFPLSYDRDKRESDKNVDSKHRKKRRKKRKKKRTEHDSIQTTSFPVELLPIENLKEEDDQIIHCERFSGGNEEETADFNIQIIKRNDFTATVERSEDNTNDEGPYVNITDIEGRFEEPDLIQFEDVEPQHTTTVSTQQGSFIFTDPVECGRCSEQHTPPSTRREDERQNFAQVIVETVEIHNNRPELCKGDIVKDGDVQDFFGVDSDGSNTNDSSNTKEKTNGAASNQEIVSPFEQMDSEMNAAEEPIARRAINVFERNQQDVMKIEQTVNKAQMADGVQIESQKAKKKRKQKKKKGKTKLKFQVDKEHLRIETLRYEQIQTDSNLNETDTKKERKKPEKKRKWKKGAKKAGENTWTVLKAGWKYLKMGMVHYSNPAPVTSVASVTGRYDARGQTKYDKWK